MEELLKIQTERVDDILLLMAQRQHMELVSLLDHFLTNSNRQGMSLGWVTLIWVAHILSQADHRMNRVQEWSVCRLETLRGSGVTTLEIRDLSDDRLADVLIPTCVQRDDFGR